MDTGSDDIKGKIVGHADSRALFKLTRVSKSWFREARPELLSRLYRCKGQPFPLQLNSITDLDVECLAACNRLYQVTFAGRMLPNLATLHGYGFRVSIADVRDAVLPTDHTSPIGGTALRQCVTREAWKEGDPPLKLLLAAIACAASGTVWRVPVQQLRNDANVGDLNLNGRFSSNFSNEARGIAAQLLAMLLAGSKSVTSIRYVAAHVTGRHPLPPSFLVLL